MSRIAKTAYEQGWSVRTMESSVRSILEKEKREKERLNHLDDPENKNESHSGKDDPANLSAARLDQMIREDGDGHSHSSSRHEVEQARAQKENLFLTDAQKQLEEYFQTSVKIRPDSIVIHYEGVRDLTRLLELLSLNEE